MAVTSYSVIPRPCVHLAFTLRSFTSIQDHPGACGAIVMLRQGPFFRGGGRMVMSHWDWTSTSRCLVTSGHPTCTGVSCLCLSLFYPLTNETEKNIILFAGTRLVRTRCTCSSAGMFIVASGSSTGTWRVLVRILAVTRRNLETNKR